MGETLFIAHRIPFPPDRGDKIRSHHLLKALAELGPVHVATLGETEADFAAEPLLAEVAASYCLVRRPRLGPAALRSLATGRAVSQQAFDSPALRKWIARLLAERQIDTVFVFSGQMGQYIPGSFAGRVIVDLCDVDSAKFEAYAREHEPLRAWIDRREARLLGAEEARLVAAADATLLVSEAEAALLRARAGSGGRILAVGNGIDTAFFDPQAAAPHPTLAGARGPHVVFTGQMDYPPNVAAVLRAAKRLMPRIRAVIPEATLHIIGRCPTDEVKALDGHDGCRVWGRVDDMAAYL
ncbi:MAG: glycosyltransferase, partial [Cypionkella sp.]